MVWHLSPQYVAGFFDGEGGIAISGSLKRGVGVNYVKWTRRVYIGNTEPSVLKMMEAKYGGSFRLWRATKAGCKPYFSISFHGDAANAFLRDILPYLTIKKERAELYLSFTDTLLLPGQHPVDPKILNLRFRIYRKMMRLNQKGDGTKTWVPQLKHPRA